MRNFRNAILRLEDVLLKREYYKKNPEKQNRFQVKDYDSKVKLGFKQVEDLGWDLLPRILNKDKGFELIYLLYSLREGKSIKEQLIAIQKLKELKVKLSKDHGIDIPSSAIHDDINADLKELKKCYDAGCYRSTVVLAGRVLEVALHKKYYDVTGVDILDKSPGIGLGKLIAKMCEKNIELDPGLTQQIHLINQVRVFSVHKKESVFNPSKAQAHAIVLFTLDVLEKLFK